MKARIIIFRFWLKIYHNMRWTLLILLVLIIIVYLVSLRLPVMTGYAAKNLCSCVFVAERDAEEVIANDLNFSFIKYTKSRVNLEEKSASSSFMGLKKRKAIYRPGLGCTLVTGLPESTIQGQSFTPPKVLPERPDTLAWPMGEVMPDTFPNGVNHDKVESAIAAFFDAPNDSAKHHTRAVVVVYKGQLIAEKYASGFDKDTPQLGWSMTKSITNAMIGILVKEGKLSVEQNNLFPEWEGDERASITLNDLLQMSSGLKWREFYADLSPATRMLYKKGDMAEYVCRQKMEAAPGKHWEYSSGTSNLLQELIKQTIADQAAYLAFPRAALFNPIGMRSAILEPDASGTFVGSSYGFATPRDWARFGLLYLNDGLWEGERILPEGWAAYTSTPAPASDGLYGAQFWLKNPEEMPDAPNDLYQCSGYQDQKVMIIPSKDLVLVRMGMNNGPPFDFNGLLKAVLNSLL